MEQENEQIEIENPEEQNLGNENYQQQQQQKYKVTCNFESLKSRYDRIPQEKIQKLKETFYASYAAVYKKILQKKLFRKEIVQEINEFIQIQIPQHLSQVLPQIELQQYRLIHKLLRIHTNGSKTWFLIHLQENCVEKFQEQIKNGQINMDNLQEYGKIIYQGDGEHIPDEVQKKIDKSFYMEIRNKAVDINNQAYLKTREQKYQDSVDLYTKSLRFDKYNCTTYNNRAYCYIMQKKYQEAESDLKNCLKIDKKFENAYKHLATIYFEKKQYLQSLNFVQQALALNSSYQEAVQLQSKINNQFIQNYQKINDQNNNKNQHNINGKRKLRIYECKYENISKKIQEDKKQK